jgi:hypothetical protein
MLPPPPADVPVTNQPIPGASDQVPAPEQQTPVPAPTEYTDTAQPTPEYTEVPAEPVTAPTVDGQENTANPTSSTGGADVSQTSGVNDVQAPTYSAEPRPLSSSSDSAAGKPETQAAMTREAASDGGRSNPSVDPVSSSPDSAAGKPETQAAMTREAASNSGRTKRGKSKESSTPNDATGVREDISVEKQEPTVD